MKEKLTQYVDGLFRAAALTVRNAELREEILQNTLEKFDDLCAGGMSEDEAYRAAVDGIGDISQLIEPAYVPPQPPAVCEAAQEDDAPFEAEDSWDFDAEADFKARKKAFESVKSAFWLLVVAGYFLCGFVFGGWAWAALLFLLAPAMTNVMDAIFYWNVPGKRRKVVESCTGALWLVITTAYFILSFATGAWGITWIVFLIGGALTGLLQALFELRGEDI